MVLAMPTDASAQRTFSFAYDQPNTTAYGIAANIFDAKLKELSGGKFSAKIRAPRLTSNPKLANWTSPPWRTSNLTHDFARPQRFPLASWRIGRGAG